MNETPLTSLITAIKTGDVAEVRGIVQAQPRLVDERPQHAPSLPLLAVYHGHQAIAKLLVEQGARVSIFEAAAMGLLEDARALLDGDPELVNAYNGDGFQPLGLASFFGHPPVARLLLDRGAEVNSASRNAQRVMPLHSAVAAASPEIVSLLLSVGAEVNAVQQGGYTPLHEAAHKGHLEILEMLLQAGARPALATEDGSTPLDLATRAGNESAAQLLRKAAAPEQPGEEHRE